MTNPIAWFMAKWLRWVFEADQKPEADWVPGEALMGDVPHVPEKLKRRAA